MIDSKTINSSLNTEPLSNINLIEKAYEQRTTLHEPANKALKSSLKPVLIDILNKLETGKLKAVEQINGVWQPNLWIKKSILLNFIINDNQVINGTPNNYFDKLLPRFQNADLSLMESIGSRIVPPACIRTGAYIGKNTVIMPSYINTGAFVDDNSMIDIWATIGSCAHIGKNSHISAGTVIGGVLEPIQDNPTVIEDHCFIGTNSAIVEGVIIEKNSIVAMGVYIGQSTKIYDRTTDAITYGRIPSCSVVIPGSMPSSNGKYNTSCAIIAKKVDPKTLSKTSINTILRNVQKVT